MPGPDSQSPPPLEPLSCFKHTRSLIDQASRQAEKLIAAKHIPNHRLQLFFFEVMFTASHMYPFIEAHQAMAGEHCFFEHWLKMSLLMELIEKEPARTLDAECTISSE